VKPHRKCVGRIAALRLAAEAGLWNAPADRLRAPPEVSARLIADASVALVDHARAERPALDQV
jgi:hypothetical protein